MILCFHDIGYANEKYVIRPEQFKKILLDNPKAEIHFDDGRYGAIQFGLPILKELKRKATLFLVPNFIMGRIPDKERYSLFMGLDTIKIWIKEGFEIGSHSYSHTQFKLETKADIDYEIGKSKSFLEHTFKVKVTKFAYPYGFVNEEIKKAAEKIYKKCYTLESDLGIKRKLIVVNP